MDKKFALLSKFNEIEGTHWWWEGRRYLLKQILGDTSPQKILDVGCGTGETLTFLHTLLPEAHLYGVDTSRDAVMYSHTRGHTNVIKADALQLPFKEKTFNVVLLLDVLEHIHEDTDVLREANRVLKPDGIIIITSPALPLLWSNHDKNQGHFRRYKKSDMKDLSEKTRMPLILLAYFNFFLSPIIITIRLLGKLPFLHSFVEYNNGVNYEVAHHPIANKILTSIFKIELWLLTKGIRYPFGVSLVAVFKKSNDTN